jgi:hypothetical protein
MMFANHTDLIPRDTPNGGSMVENPQVIQNDVWPPSHVPTQVYGRRRPSDKQHRPSNERYRDA